MNDEVGKPSLRQRKRAATRAAIADHATLLVAEKGFDNVTVEDICAAAGVSRRTFFNYVDSKESAVLGDPPRALSKEEITTFLSVKHDNLLGATMHLAGMTSGLFDRCPALDGSPDDGDTAAQLLRRRKQIIHDNPGLSLQRIHAQHEAFHSMVFAVTEYLNLNPEAKKLTSDAATESATLVSMALGALQLGFMRWMVGTDPTLRALTTACADALRDIQTLSQTPEK